MILCEISWIPNPIREAFLLNSDLAEFAAATAAAGGGGGGVVNGFDEAGSFSGCC